MSEPENRPSVGRLGRDTLIYGLGFMLQRAASFIMLPIYTRYLSPEDYGTLQLLQMTLDVVTILLSAGLTAAVMRFYFKYDQPRERSAVVVSALAMMLGANVIGALGLVATAPELGRLVLDDARFGSLFYIMAASFVLDPCVTIATVLMQATQRAALYTAVSLVRLGVQLSLNILFVVVLDEGVRGILLSTLLTYVVLTPFTLAWTLRRTGLPWIKSIATEVFWFGLPYRVTDLGAFILTYADRYFLVATHGKAATGVYALAYQFGFMLGYLGAVPFFLAWNPQRFQWVKAERADRDRFYDQGALFLSILMVSLALGISVLVRPVLEVMSAPSFWDAASLVPVVLLAYLLQAWTQVVEFGIQVSERTRATTIATWIAVAVVMALYWLLIPPFGAWGAAVATVIAFVVRLVAFYIFAQRLWPVTYRLRPHLSLLALASSLTVVHFTFAPTGIVVESAFGLSICAVFAVLAWRGVLSVDERALMRAGATRYLKAIRQLLARGGAV